MKQEVKEEEVEVKGEHDDNEWGITIDGGEEET